MIRALRAVLFLSVCTLSLFGCEQELVDATQVLIRLRGDLNDDLSSVEAAIYDVTGENRSDQWEFELNAHPLPFSFAVVPKLKTTTAFMVVLTGKDADAKPVLESRAIIQFVPRATIGVELWLDRECLGRTCGANETCVALSASEIGCGAIPMPGGEMLARGKDLDAWSTTETSPVVASDAETPIDTRVDTDASDSVVPMVGTDASIPADAGVDAAPAVISGACSGSPGQVVCADAVLNHCNEVGQVEKEETCQSARQCQLGLAGKSCAPCSPGARRCTGVRLERCSEDGSQWELTKSCESEALCNAIAGDCVSGACTAATRACMNGGLYGCSQDLTQLTLLKPCTANLCDQTSGECDVCIANARTCSGNFVEACDSRGQAVARTECTGTTPKCTGAGTCVQCTAATDCAAPSTQCQMASCNTSTARCGSAPRAAHTSCTGGVCNGSGSCIECVDDTDCKTTGARKCSNSRCVPCVANADCPATYECTTSQTCQKVSLKGTGATCSSYGTPSGSMCGSYYCGVSQQRLAAALDPAALCNIPASLVCSGELTSLAMTCSQMFTADAILDESAFRSKTSACMRANAPSAVSDACLGCYAEVGFCCAKDTLGCENACVAGASAECDAAMKKKNCVSPLFSCSGLPNPL